MVRSTIFGPSIFGTAYDNGIGHIWYDDLAFTRPTKGGKSSARLGRVRSLVSKAHTLAGQVILCRSGQST
jgi:hypothetical protein